MNKLVNIPTLTIGINAYYGTELNKFRVSLISTMYAVQKKIAENHSASIQQCDNISDFTKNYEKFYGVSHQIIPLNAASLINDLWKRCADRDDFKKFRDFSSLGKNWIHEIEHIFETAIDTQNNLGFIKDVNPKLLQKIHFVLLFDVEDKDDYYKMHGIIQSNFPQNHPIILTFIEFCNHYGLNHTIINDYKNSGVAFMRSILLKRVETDAITFHDDDDIFNSAISQLFTLCKTLLINDYTDNTFDMNFWFGVSNNYVLETHDTPSAFSYTPDYAPELEWYANELEKQSASPASSYTSAYDRGSEKQSASPTSSYTSAYDRGSEKQITSPTFSFKTTYAPDSKWMYFNGDGLWSMYISKGIAHQTYNSPAMVSSEDKQFAEDLGLFDKTMFSEYSLNYTAYDILPNAAHVASKRWDDISYERDALRGCKHSNLYRPARPKEYPCEFSVVIRDNFERSFHDDMALPYCVTENGVSKVYIDFITNRPHSVQRTHELIEQPRSNYNSLNLDAYQIKNKKTGETLPVPAWNEYLVNQPYDKLFGGDLINTVITVILWLLVIVIILLVIIRCAMNPQSSIMKYNNRF